MTRFARASVSIVILLVLAAVPASAKKKRAKPTDDLAAYEQVFANAWPADGPGGAVIVVRNGEVLYRAAVGMADIELGVALEPDMVFRLGSVTKQFTAASIMLLVEDGKVALDDPITKFLPDYPTNGHTITVEHLLTHTSGIFSYTNIPGYMQAEIAKDLTVTELVDVFREIPMEFAPGVRWNYSNSGYVLLGAIIEEAGGLGYAEFVETRIFGPLGMQQSYYGGLQLIPRRVSGYEGGGDAEVRNASYLSMTQPYAAGSLLSTVDDLVRWNRALYAGEVVNEASLEAMITSYTLSDGSSANYGYGLSPSTLRGSPTIGHGGGINGFRTQVTYLPDEDVFVAVLQNSPAAPGPGALANKAAAIAIGRPFREFTAIELPAEKLAPYVGVYRIDEATNRVITLEDGQLFSQRDGGARLELHAGSEEEFFYENSLTWVHFVVDGDGTVTAMEVFQNGADDAETAEKTSDEVPELVVVEVDPATLADYVGVFELAPGFELAVTQEGDALFGQATGQPKIGLVPQGDGVFTIPQVGATLTFTRDAAGRVISVTLDQGGQHVVGPRKGS